MAKYWKKRVLLFRLEAIYGADPTPTGSEHALQATDVTLMPMEGNDISRELVLPNMGAQGTLPAELHSKLTFKVELAPSGAAGTAPAWGPLLRACACAETIVAATSVTYNPVTDGHESGTFWFNMDGTLVKISGARGTATFRFSAQGIPYLELEFTGLFSVPTDAVRPTPDTTGFRAPELSTTANTPVFTIDGQALVMRSLSMALGNAVQNRFLIGSESILITDRAEMVETVVEATPMATLNPFALAAAQTLVPVVLQHGVAAGRRATLNIAQAQMQRPQAAQDAQGIIEWPLRLVPQAQSGNDQWTLVLT